MGAIDGRFPDARTAALLGQPARLLVGGSIPPPVAWGNSGLQTAARVVRLLSQVTRNPHEGCLRRGSAAVDFRRHDAASASLCEVSEVRRNQTLGV